MKKLSSPVGTRVYFGPMFSGKTGELIEFVTRAQIAGFKAQIFKPDFDDRGEGLTFVKSKSGAHFPAQPVKKSKDIYKLLKKDTGVVGIDEAQFYDSDIVEVVNSLAKEHGLQVVICGLPTDFRNEPFGQMPILMAQAKYLTQCFAVCTYRETQKSKPCGEVATRTQRLVDGNPAKRSDPIVLIGAAESYQARCVKHHIVLP